MSDRFRPFMLLAVMALGSAAMHAEKITVRVGYFPNITHAQAIVGSQTTREQH